jgi:NADP-dependent 3-hydroxy acid dehydrogenase YdfG
VAIVTGAGSGIGAAVAADLANAGAHVTMVGRRPDRLQAVASHIRSSGHSAMPEPGDIRDYAQMEAIVESTVARWGRLDVLIANAAVVEQSTISTGDPMQWRTLIDTNVTGTFNCVRAALPPMHLQNAGHIVIVASVSGRVTYVGEPAYVASKHALVAMGDCLRQELAPTGIRVTIIEPGLVATEFLNAEVVDSLAPGVAPLASADVARAIRFAIDQPPGVNINEIVIRPAGQVL